MQFIKTFIFLVAIPLIGIGVSVWVLNDLNVAIADAGIDISAAQLCALPEAELSGQLIQVCSDIAPILWMRTASTISGIAAIVLMFSFIVCANVAGQNRTKVAKIFPPLVFLTLVVLTILVVIQGAILTYSAYLAEIQLIQRWHIYLIGAIGLGALAAAYGLMKSSVEFTRKRSHDVVGAKLDPNDHPDLFKTIKNISETLGSRNPDHVIVGLEPNFYVTSADVKLFGVKDPLEGETLYLSLPLARILTRDEITGIIGHELGHFRGEDTYYSLRFSPVYAGLSHALQNTHATANDGIGGIAKLPAFTVLSYMIEVFHKNVSAISREREFAADKAASEVAPPEALASSLLKIGLYAGAWYSLENRVVGRMQKGIFARNLSLLFASIVKYDVNEETLPEVIDKIAEQTISHPTDSHPPTANRISELGLNIDNIERDLLRMPEDTCIGLFDKPEALEQSLTELQQRYFMALGVQVPRERTASPPAMVLAAFGAHMVVADGKVEPEEIDKAEEIGLALTPEFDNIDFREFCHHPETIPALDKLIESSKEVNDDAKALIHDYLSKIASSDGDVSPEEARFLADVKSEFGL